jgi:hypothetical protein
MQSKQRSARWLVAAALLVGLAPALGAYAAPVEVQPTTQGIPLWQTFLSWVDGWWTPADDLGNLQAAAGGGPQTGGGGEQGTGLDPDGTDPDPTGDDEEEDPGLPPGMGG